MRYNGSYHMSRTHVYLDFDGDLYFGEKYELREEGTKLFIQIQEKKERCQEVWQKESEFYEFEHLES